MDESLSISEAADLLNVSIETLRLWDSNGVLVSSKTNGGHRRYTRNQIMNYIASNRQTDHQEYIDSVFPHSWHEGSFVWNFPFTRQRDYFASILTQIQLPYTPFIHKNIHSVPIPEGKRKIIKDFKAGYFFGKSQFTFFDFPLEPIEGEEADIIEKRWAGCTLTTIPYRELTSVQIELETRTMSGCSKLKIQAKDSTQFLLGSQSRFDGDQLSKVYLVLRESL